MSPLISLILNVIIPSLILSKGGKYIAIEPHHLLFLALSFPVAGGLYEFVRFRKADFISIFGFVSILLTGGFSLMELTSFWFAVKEAAIPGLIGIFVIASSGGKNPLVHKVLYNEKIIDVERVGTALAARGMDAQFSALLKTTAFILAGSFFLSSVLNFVLASVILTSQPGTPTFNEELGRLTALSYPVIALPSMLVMIYALLRMVRELKKLTGLGFEEILRADPKTTATDQRK